MDRLVIIVIMDVIDIILIIYLFHCAAMDSSASEIERREQFNGWLDLANGY
jgi:hypothetical protein